MSTMSKPVAAPRTREGKQVAKTSLEKVTGDLSVDEARRAPARDLNLTALISEVERDIWMLEQMEQRSSKFSQLSSTAHDEAVKQQLPFPITQEILSLPGYKPKTIPQGTIKCLINVGTQISIHPDSISKNLLRTCS